MRNYRLLNIARVPVLSDDVVWQVGGSFEICFRRSATWLRRKKAESKPVRFMPDQPCLTVAVPQVSTETMLLRRAVPRLVHVYMDM